MAKTNLTRRHTYKSRVNWWYGLLIILLLALCGKGGEYWIVGFLSWVSVIFLASLIFLKRYVVEGENLTVFYGFFLKKTIPVSSITSIQPTHNAFGYPALSLCRLSIRYNKYDEILVSPEEPEAFVAALKAVNPKILTQKG
ncbi:MAG: PH domain-containing protein [Prevotella sp.]